jgi:hypothetical protein
MASQTARHESRRLKSLGGAHRRSLGPFSARERKKVPWLVKERQLSAEDIEQRPRGPCSAYHSRLRPARLSPSIPIEMGLMDYEAAKARPGPKGRCSTVLRPYLRASIPLSGISGWPNGCGGSASSTQVSTKSCVASHVPYTCGPSGIEKRLVDGRETSISRGASKHQPSFDSLGG